MKKRTFDEMVSYFNRKVADMEIDRKYKMELLGMVTALGFKHEKSVQPEIIRCKDCIKRDYCRTTNVWAVPPDDDWYCGDAERRTDDSISD